MSHSESSHKNSLNFYLTLLKKFSHAEAAATEGENLHWALNSSTEEPLRKETERERPAEVIMLPPNLHQLPLLQGGAEQRAGLAPSIQ